MVLQEGVNGRLEGHGVAWESHDLPHGTSTSGVAANAGSSSVPCGRDSPGPAVVHKLSSQQIGHLLR
jgi:hypothetical protein